MTVELRTRKREIPGYVGKRYEKLGLKRSSCVSQMTIPDRAVTTQDSVGKKTDTRSSKSNQASRTPDCSCPLVSSILFPSSSHFSLSHPQLYHHRRIESSVIPLYLFMT